MTRPSQLFGRARLARFRWRRVGPLLVLQYGCWRHVTMGIGHSGPTFQWMANGGSVRFNRDCRYHSEHNPILRLGLVHSQLLSITSPSLRLWQQSFFDCLLPQPASEINHPTWLSALFLSLGKAAPLIQPLIAPAMRHAPWQRYPAKKKAPISSPVRCARC